MPFRNKFCKLFQETITIMKILAVHRFYWPDQAPLPMMLRTMVNDWQSSGHSVTVFSSQPSYGRGGGQLMPRLSVENGVTVHRTGKFRRKRSSLHKLLGHLRFLSSLLIFLKKHAGDFDCIYVSTTPPILAATCVSLIRNLGSNKSIRLIYHIQDLYPENLELLGMIRTNGFLSSALKRLDAYNCKSSHRIIALSSDMVRTLANGRKMPFTSNRFVTINNFDMPKGASDERFHESAPSIVKETKLSQRNTRKNSPSIRIVYAGNFGPFQNTLFLAHTLERNCFDNIEFVFAGDGSEYEKFVEISSRGNNEITFLGPISVEEVHDLLRTANWALITLANRITEVAYPSKTMTYAKIGCPIIAVTDDGSELTSVIEDNHLGYVVGPDDAESFCHCLMEINRGASNLTQSGDVAARMLDVYETEFSWKVMRTKWARVLDAVHDDLSAKN